MSTSRSTRVQKAAQSFHEEDDLDEADDLIDCGINLAQESGGSVYGLLPAPFSDNHGLEQGEPVKTVYHMKYQVFITIPVDVSTEI